MDDVHRPAGSRGVHATTRSGSRSNGRPEARLTRAGFGSAVRDRYALFTLHDYHRRMTEPTLIDWAGGPARFRALIDAFYDRVERADLLSPLFPGGVHEEHRAHVTAWWVEVFGGPAEYTREHGGYPTMLRHHLDLAITPEQRFRFATLMSHAADDAALPDDPEFRAAFVGYVEWGTRLAMGNSQPGAGVVAQAPVPRWGWGIAPPYQP